MSSSQYTAFMPGLGCCGEEGEVIESAEGFAIRGKAGARGSPLSKELAF